VRFVFAMILGLVAFTQAPSAEAARWRFGTSDELRFVQQTQIKEGASTLYLARKLRTENFLLPYMIADDGYVLAAASDSYYPLDEAKIKEFQAKKMLPDPLPPFKLETMDYVLGYAAWIAIAVIASWIGISAMWNRHKSESA
jgi:hypothetical protein